MKKAIATLSMLGMLATLVVVAQPASAICNPSTSTVHFCIGSPTTVGVNAGNVHVEAVLAADGYYWGWVCYDLPNAQPESCTYIIS